jgi:hypothetical protein
MAPRDKIECACWIPGKGQKMLAKDSLQLQAASAQLFKEA